MKVLEAVNEVNRLNKLIGKVDYVDNVLVCAHYVNTKGISFSVWIDGTDPVKAPLFNDNLDLIKENGYEGDIEQAREALKQYLDKDV